MSAKVLKFNSNTQDLPTPKKDRPTTDYKSADELIKLATVDFSSATNQADRIELMKQLILNSLPVAEGLYRSRPSQSNAYALSSLLGKLQDLDKLSKDMVNFESVASECVSEVIKPFLEKLILELGRLIRTEFSPLKDSLKSKERKAVKQSIDSIYRKFGEYIQTNMESVEKNVLEVLTN